MSQLWRQIDHTWSRVLTDPGHIICLNGQCVLASMEFTGFCRASDLMQTLLSFNHEVLRSTESSGRVISWTPRFLCRSTWRVDKCSAILFFQSLVPILGILHNFREWEGWWIELFTGPGDALPGTTRLWRFPPVLAGQQGSVWSMRHVEHHGVGSLAPVLHKEKVQHRAAMI